MKITILVIDNEYGLNITHYPSREAATAYLHEYVLEWWDAEITSEEMPDDREEAIKMYFELVGNERAEIEEFDLSDQEGS